MTRGEPRTVSEILEHFKFEDLKRTVRNRGTNYYKSTKDERYSIKSDIGTNIVFRFEDPETLRKESVTYNYKEKRVYKFFKDTSQYKRRLRNMEFDFIENEEEGFQRMLIEENKFFPDYQDYRTATDLYDMIVLDSFSWESEVEKRAQERMSESARQYHAKYNLSPWWLKR